MRLALFLAALASPALAQDVAPCGPLAQPDNIVEPWADNSRTFANGDVRIALLDTVEPAIGSFHLMILHPPRDDFGGRVCTTISAGQGTGYPGILFSDLEAGYDPGRGLVFNVPAIGYLPDEDFYYSVRLTVVVNQSTGDVTAKQIVVSE